MKERPILFSGPMVQAILDGSKTQTRRVVKVPGKQNNNPRDIQHREPGDKWYKDSVWSMRIETGLWGDYTQEQFMAKCPYGQIGDRLWVRETIESDYETDDRVVLTRYSADKKPVLYNGSDDPEYDGSVAHWDYEKNKLPSIFMPRWVSRINLGITNTRVERLQDISEEDAKAEGVQPFFGRGTDPNDQYPYYDCYHELWDKINGPGSWDKNPFVWVVEFGRVL